ncbi:RNA polymerase sigma factor SigI [Acetivibrio clariflavus]|uniref:RNA polymerase sigma factor SigI n=1 Tax=Acetivibrio clariflavus (strain DSM 19732 / NBRC 101661 / EBR45) TaxID=720554 RepID=G8LTQ8_ACECE|nr:RNA polymerase sigma factor SigI [Acetivibrio clariflavus]AEV70568.1 RNA polymerase sigma-I factor [Acetivibrio clariflavus DSM 19732]
MNSLTINERVESIKNDEYGINKFIEEYKPFIASCVEKIVGRYVVYGQDDELSIALIAFSEAIKAFDSSRGNFLSFAQNVIKRRIIDYYRKESKYNNVVFLKQHNDEEDEEDSDQTAEKAFDEYLTKEISQYRRFEIEQLKEELKEWGISFFELPDVSPKHKKTRRIYSQVIKFLLSDPELLSQIKEKKALPVTQIEKCLKIPRKKIDRGRKYILAAIVICTGDYEFIRDYISWE